MLTKSTDEGAEKSTPYQTGRSKATVVQAGLNYFPFVFMSRLLNALRIVLSMVTPGLCWSQCGQG